MGLLLTDIKSIFRIHLFISTVFLLITNSFELNSCFELMFIYSLWSLYIFICLIIEEYTTCNGLSIELIYLSACLLRFIWPGITSSLGALQGEKFTYMRDYNDVTLYIFPTLIAMNIAYMLFYYILKKFRTSYSIEDNLYYWVNKFNVIPLAIFLLLSDFILRSSFQDTLSFLPAIISNFVGKLGLGAILLLIFNTSFNYSKHSFILLIISIICEVIFNMFFTYFKSAIFTPLFLLLAYYLYRAKLYGTNLFSKTLVMYTVITVMFVNYIVFPFIELKRIENNFDSTTGKGINNVPTMQLISNVISNIGVQKTQENNHSFSSRQNALLVNAFYYGDVVRNHNYHTELLEKSILVAIPKFLYPNKPLNDIGLMASGYASEGNIFDTRATSAYTYVGFFGSSFFIGGWISVFCFMILNGLVISLVRNYYIYHSDNIVAIFFYFMLLMTAMGGFEEIHDGGVLRMIMLCSNMFIIKLIDIVTKFRV